MLRRAEATSAAGRFAGDVIPMRVLQYSQATAGAPGSPISQTYIQYTPHGAVSRMSLGELGSGQWALNEQRGYNSRFQTTSIILLNSAAGPFVA